MGRCEAILGGPRLEGTLPGKPCRETARHSIATSRWAVEGTQHESLSGTHPAGARQGPRLASATRPRPRSPRRTASQRIRPSPSTPSDNAHRHNGRKASRYFRRPGTQDPARGQHPAWSMLGRRSSSLEISSFSLGSPWNRRSTTFGTWTPGRPRLAATRNGHPRIPVVPVRVQPLAWSMKPRPGSSQKVCGTPSHHSRHTTDDTRFRHESRRHTQEKPSPGASSTKSRLPASTTSDHHSRLRTPLSSGPPNRRRTTS